MPRVLREGAGETDPLWVVLEEPWRTEQCSRSGRGECAHIRQGREESGI